MNVLWHGDDPVGVCVFAAPAACLAGRSKFFGLSNPSSAVAVRAVNEQVWLLQRVVLHPTYRGAGVAAAFVRHCCERVPVPWVETLTAMGRVNPVFDRAGFVRVEVPRPPAGRKPDGRNGAFGGSRRAGAAPPVGPAYFVFRTPRGPVRPAAGGV